MLGGTRAHSAQHSSTLNQWKKSKRRKTNKTYNHCLLCMCGAADGDAGAAVLEFDEREPSIKTQLAAFYVMHLFGFRLKINAFKCIDNLGRALNNSQLEPHQCIFALYLFVRCKTSERESKAHRHCMIYAFPICSIQNDRNRFEYRLFSWLFFSTK